jgi:hypothetical protein
MSRPQEPKGGAMYPCPRCQRLAKRVQRRRWTRVRMLTPVVLGLVATGAFTIAIGSFAFGVLVGMMVAAIGFALAPDTYLNLECESCGYEEEVKQ